MKHFSFLFTIMFSFTLYSQTNKISDLIRIKADTSNNQLILKFFNKSDSNYYVNKFRFCYCRKKILSFFPKNESRIFEYYYLVYNDADTLIPVNMPHISYKAFLNLNNCCNDDPFILVTPDMDFIKQLYFELDKYAIEREQKLLKDLDLSKIKLSIIFYYENQKRLEKEKISVFNIEY